MAALGADRRPVTASALGLLATVFLLGAFVPTASAAVIFDLADHSAVIVRGVVQGVTGYRNDTLRVFTIKPEEVLKGDAAPGTPLALVQERVFGTERPYFEPGTRTLVFAVPLPMYSSYRQVLPEKGGYLGWTERKDTAAEIAPLADPALVEPVVRYLAARDDVRATARLLGGLLVAPVPRLRGDALAVIEARPALTPFLDAQALAPLDSFLGDAPMPVTERAQILVRLARLGAAGIAPVAEKAEAAGGPLQAAAVDALMSLGRPPDEKRLLAYSRSDDAALRLAAVRGLARAESASALDRVEEILTGDPSSEVRLGALSALGGARGERPVALLAAALRDADKERVNAAADALGKIGGPAAITALGDALAHGPYDAQVAAAFTLAQMRSEQALTILREQQRTHPDPRVRNVIALAVGDTVDKHE
jgi:HEAT repeat protein